MYVCVDLFADKKGAVWTTAFCRIPFTCGFMRGTTHISTIVETKFFDQTSKISSENLQIFTKYNFME